MAWFQNFKGKKNGRVHNSDNQSMINMIAQEFESTDMKNFQCRYYMYLYHQII